MGAQKIKYQNIGEVVKVYELLQQGIAYHHSHELQNLRELIEILMKETARDTELIHGFWFAVLGMAEGEIDELVLLEACVDDRQSPPANIHPLAVAGDGWDDREAPGVLFCQSYGSGELRFTRLIFKIEILSIEKGE